MTFSVYMRRWRQDVVRVNARLAPSLNPFLISGNKIYLFLFIFLWEKMERVFSLRKISLLYIIYSIYVRNKYISSEIMKGKNKGIYDLFIFIMSNIIYL